MIALVLPYRLRAFRCAWNRRIVSLHHSVDLPSGRVAWRRELGLN